MNLEIANRLVELRRARGLSQEELAAQLGVSRQAVSKWERAESSPDTDNLIALARLYGISLDGLLLNRETGGGAAAQAEYAAPSAADEAEQVFAAADAWDEAEESRRRARKAERRRRLLIFPYPVLVTIVFLIIGFLFGAWHPGWMIYLTIPLYYCVAAGM